MNHIISSFLKQIPDGNDVSGTVDRKDFILNTLLGDYKNEISACLSQLDGESETDHVHVRLPLELYGSQGENSWVLDDAGGALTEKDIEEHSCKKLIGSIISKVNRINTHLKKKRSVKARSEAEQLQKFLTVSARKHPLRHSF